MQPSEENQGIIESLESKALKNRSWAVRLADDLTGFFGSMWFLGINLGLFIFWILANTGRLPGVSIFDPYPFILLITAVSLEAIILTTVVLMSQNRQALISSLREELDMQVNLIAEREITKALKLLRILLKERGVEIKDQELEEMLKEIDASYMERELAEQLKPKPRNIFKTVATPIVKPIEKAAEAVEKRVLGEK